MNRMLQRRQKVLAKAPSTRDPKRTLVLCNLAHWVKVKNPKGPAVTRGGGRGLGAIGERTRRDLVTLQAHKMISKTTTPDRNKITIEREDHLKYWTRHFGVTKDELAHAIERVGNSAAAVRKQLSATRAT
jgi:hypothetical protein